MTFPRISIVIPSFNQGEYLEQSIQSLLSQNYHNLELILIDGGSQDSSLDVIHKYVDRLAYWVSEPDRGQGHAINKGFTKCTGEIVTFLSSDDTYAAGTFMDVATHFQGNPNVGAIVGAFQFQDEASNIVSEPVKPWLASAAPIDLTLVNPDQYRLHQVSTFYVRAMLEKVGFWVREDLAYVMDRELLYRVCREFPVLLTDRVYGIFRKHEESKSEQSILPFADEFAKLYLESMTGEADKDRIREKNARFFRASGLIKFAKATDRFSDAVESLLKALVLVPAYLFSYTYLSAWKKAFQNYIAKVDK